MRTIIRVEHPSDGNGIWRHKGNGYWTVPETVSARHNRFLNRGEELEQLRGNIYEIREKDNLLYCGYKSLEQFQQWIMLDELQWFISKGFNILMIDVSECIEGKDQILFEKKYILQTKIINSLFI